MAHPVSDMEATFYYAGLPSGPRLVARSSSITTPWIAPTGPEAYPQRKELRPVGNHPLNDVWEQKLAPDVLALLESMTVKWTSVDVVRIVNAGEPSASAPVIIWIGIIPESLSPANGLDVALKCKEVLQQNDITDVDVELRESVVTRSVCPKFLEPTFDSDPTVNVREPLTATLGLPICAQSTPWAEGTGGFYMAEGGDSKRILLVTARHVVFPPNDNDMYDHKNTSQPRRRVLLLGDGAFKNLLDSIQVEIKQKALMIPYLKARINKVKNVTGDVAERGRRKAEDGLTEVKEAMEALNTFYKDVSTCWASPDKRVLGHVIYSPPIEFGVGTEQCTQDFAVIEVDPSKIDARNFKGNAIDLGTRVSVGDFTCMMSPNLQNAHTFEYPVDRLLRLKGTIPKEDMCHPPALDQNGEPCLMVIKRGIATDLTIGRANNIFSYARNYFNNNHPQISKEWAILPFDKKSGPFSDKGDSGSVIVDDSGRIGGLLTGGAGSVTPSLDLDVTYATPIDFLMSRITQGFEDVHLNPVLTT